MTTVRVAVAVCSLLALSWGVSRLESSAARGKAILIAGMAMFGAKLGSHYVGLAISARYPKFDLTSFTVVIYVVALALVVLAFRQLIRNERVRASTGVPINRGAA